MNEQKQFHCRLFRACGFCTWIFVFGHEQKRREDKHVKQHHVTEQFRALSILKQSMLLLRKELVSHKPDISSNTLWLPL